MKELLEKKLTLVYKLAYTACIQVLSAVSAFLVLSHFSRNLEAQDFGVLSLVLAIGSFILMPSFFGQAMYSLKNYAGDSDSSQVHISNALMFSGAVSSCILFFIIIKVKTTIEFYEIIPILLMVFFYTILQYSRYRLLACGYKNITVFMVSLLPNILIYVLSKEAGEGWVVSYIIAYAVCLFLAVIVIEYSNSVKNIYKLSFSGVFKDQFFDWHASLTFFRTSIYQSVAKFGDLLAVSIILPVEVAAVYLIASRIAKVPELLLNAVNLNFVRRFSILAKNNEYGLIKVLFFKCQIVLLVFMVMFLVVVFFGYDEIVLRYFPLIKGYDYLLWILILSTLVNVVSGPAGQVLSVSGNHRFVEKVSMYVGFWGAIAICLAAMTKQVYTVAFVAMLVSTARNISYLVVLMIDLRKNSYE